MKKLLLCCLFLPFWSLTLRAEPAELLTDHPLAGTLWHVGEKRQASPEELFAAAAEARWILLGEKHDNAEHHRIQAEVVGAVGERERRPALVWEMAQPEHDAVLKAATAEQVDGLGDAIQWEQRGWPSWPEYQPIAEQALKYGMTMAAGDAPPAVRRNLGKGGSLDADTAADIGWSRDYNDDQRRRLMELLALSHCGMLPEKVLPAMADVQRLRDAWIAKVMRDEGAEDGAILIAGAEHVRRDRGVPWHLLPLEDEMLALAAVEVVRDVADPEAYPSFDPEQFDYVWFTARVDEKDPCEAFRKSST
ncbi:ChaN family lipoprotein [Denitrobaculum tricleocarpae]|uniref:ChaN family lipoprotein n=1 Tax=Denitrobaculum tricleocarpae TaxID=2591009 RepID=A0A545U157_9PROT|nr:ChaN family lipoprotein [Denitrobaculum tricleocarpae]TQV83176.1 ChaN family lipoprotein [Denitrobaculum tricleocarpae]